jgi:hypothetical protein
VNFWGGRYEDLITESAELEMLSGASKCPEKKFEALRRNRFHTRVNTATEG